MKSDRSIRDICIAAIKRKTIKPYDFAFTRFFEKETFAQIDRTFFSMADFNDDELPISQVVIDLNNWTVVSTGKIVSCINGKQTIVFPENVVSWDWALFKNESPFVNGKLYSKDGESFEFFIETGRASIVQINSISTLVNLKAEAAKEINA